MASTYHKRKHSNQAESDESVSLDDPQNHAKRPKLFVRRTTGGLRLPTNSGPPKRKAPRAAQAFQTFPQHLIPLPPRRSNRLARRTPVSFCDALPKLPDLGTIEEEITGFLQFPTEIRNQIYDEALKLAPIMEVSCRGFVLRGEYGHNDGQYHAPAPFPEWAFTCKIILNDVLNLLQKHAQWSVRYPGRGDGEAWNPRALILLQFAVETLDFDCGPLVQSSDTPYTHVPNENASLDLKDLVGALSVTQAEGKLKSLRLRFDKRLLYKPEARAIIDLSVLGDLKGKIPALEVTVDGMYEDERDTIRFERALIKEITRVGGLVVPGEGKGQVFRKVLSRLTVPNTRRSWSMAHKCSHWFWFTKAEG